MENPFGMVVMIVAICVGASLIKHAIRAKTAWHEQGWNDRMAQWGEVEDRLSRLEKRMANLETIVLEREKQREFDRELK
jgi:hypothetical protein